MNIKSRAAAAFNAALFLFIILSASFPVTAEAQVVAETVMLPNGWRLTPAGRQFPLGDLPLNMAVSSNGKWIAVTNNGYGRQCVNLFDARKERMTDDVTLPYSWYGLCFSPDSRKLYVSGGNENKIRVYSVGGKGKLTLCDSIVMGKKWPVKISPSGIAVSKKNNLLAVATRRDNSLYLYKLSDNSLVRKEDIGSEGYDLLFSKDEKMIYISCWGGEKVRVWDVASCSWIKDISVGSHPNEMCLDKKGERLFVANADDNSVSVIDLSTLEVEETLNAALFPNSLSGSTTNGLAVTPDGQTLAIANADNNCVTLFDISEKGESRSLGFIPSGWYPTNVKCVGKKLWVTNGKGLKSVANPDGPQPANVNEDFGHHSGDARHSGSQYIAKLFLGAMSVIDMPDAEELKKYSAQVFDNTPYKLDNERYGRRDAQRDAGNPIPVKAGGETPIKYVFYIIKENRTYDQVLGDVKEGNGDSSLCLFGKYITPNQHKLVNEFVLLDNFYVNAEVSCDGHNWTMGGYANDFLEKTWPTYYSGRGDFYAGEGAQKMGNNKSGFLWDACKKAGVTFRSYGEFASRVKGVITPSVSGLEGNLCMTFEPWSLSVRDTVRFREWRADFDSLLRADALPSFNVIRMGGDHTQGMKAGKMTPFAHAADNDLAVGMFLDYLSHSSVWKESAVFIVEDDAQNGADHVDAHRSTVYLASPYVRRGYIDHTPYTTTSVLRTMELILGLSPMTQYDASATPMWKSFTGTCNPAPFVHLPSNVNLDEVNVRKNKWQAMSENYDFTKEDNVPDVEFNKVLWHGIKGDAAAYPAIRRSAFLIYSAEAEDDD